jgi:flavin-dependent thymidylate synthase
MKLKVTGDVDFIAHSAWISTVNEMRANARTHEDKIRVVQFLVEHHHTSPLEGITLTFTDFVDAENREVEDVFLDFAVNKFAKFTLEDDDAIATIDLLNFCKMTLTPREDDDVDFGILWDAFAEQRPELALILTSFGPIEEHFAEELEADLLGEHNMSVQLVQFHDGGSREHSRASWRVKCPLSISVQILRHRSGSYNQVSGRYKTIRQELFETPDDCAEIAARMGENLDKYMGSAEACIARYLQFMRKAKKSRDDEVISNDEYKRMREVARFILPEGRMTELYITYYLDDFYDNYLRLRDSEHAQTEHIWIAQEMRKTLEQHKTEDQE